MRCPHCHSIRTTERSDRTTHDYRRFRCLECGRGFNERTGSVLNRLQLPSDVVFLIVLWRLRFKLSLRCLAEILLLRGLVFLHETVHDWETKLASLLPDTLRQRRRARCVVGGLFGDRLTAGHQAGRLCLSILCVPA